MNQLRRWRDRKRFEQFMSRLHDIHLIALDADLPKTAEALKAASMAAIGEMHEAMRVEVVTDRHTLSHSLTTVTGP